MPRARSSHPQRRHTPTGQPDTLPFRPLRPPPRLVRYGITRSPRTSGSAPLTERQQTVLAALADEWSGASDLARQLRLSTREATSALYALSARGLADHVPYRGWRKAAAATEETD